MKPKGKDALMQGYSGKLGNQFSLRQRHGETIMAALPSVPPEATYHAAISAFMHSNGKISKKA